MKRPIIWLAAALCTVLATAMLLPLPAAAQEAPAPAAVAEITLQPAAGDPSSHATIQEAVNHAADGDTILLSAGEYTENITIPHNLTITGTGSSSCKVTGQWTVSESCSITGLTLEYNEADPNITGSTVVRVYGMQKKLTLTDCIISQLGNAGGIALGGSADNPLAETSTQPMLELKRTGISAANGCSGLLLRDLNSSVSLQDCTVSIWGGTAPLVQYSADGGQVILAGNNQFFRSATGQKAYLENAGDGSFLNVYSQLTGAVNLARAGSTITLPEGTHTADLTINRSLTIKAEPAETGKPVPVVILEGHLTGGEGEGNLTLSGITLTGTRGAAITQALNSKIGFTLQNCKVSGYDQAILLQSSLPAGIMVNNTRFSGIKQAAIEGLQFAGRAVMSGNTFQDCGIGISTDGTAKTSGVLNFDTLFTSNRFNGNQADIRYQQKVGGVLIPPANVRAASSSPVTLSGNSLGLGNSATNAKILLLSPYPDPAAALVGIQPGDTILLTESFVLSSPLELGTSVTLNGMGNTLSASNSFSGQSLVRITADNTSLLQLSLNAQGISYAAEVHSATGVACSAITLKNSRNSGLLLDSAQLAINNITLENNSKAGVRVVKYSGLSPSLSITGTFTFAKQPGTILLIEPSAADTPVALPAGTNLSVQAGTDGSVRYVKTSDGTQGYTDYANEEFTFWRDVERQVWDAQKKDVITVKAKDYTEVPVTLLKSLKGKDVTLVITGNSTDPITIHGSQVQPIEQNRIYYPIKELAKLYQQVVSSQAPSVPAVSSRPTISSSSAAPPPPVSSAPAEAQQPETPPSSSEAPADPVITPDPPQRESMPLWPIIAGAAALGLFILVLIINLIIRKNRP